MKIHLKIHCLFAAIVLTCIFSYNCWSEDGLDTITRKIQCRDNAVWVIDDLHYSEGIAGVQGDLWDIYYDLTKRGSCTNLEYRVAKLLEGEDLSLQRQTASYTNGYVDLHLVSTVRFSFNRAHLHWVASMGGLTIRPREWQAHPEQIGHTEYLGGRIENQMLIYKSDHSFVLWFPDVGLADYDLANAEEFEDLFDFRKFKEIMKVQNDQRYSCAVEGAEPVTLLDWNVSMTNKIPDFKFLEIINSQHKISENDLINMCTPMKIAKGGYYQILETNNDNK